MHDEAHRYERATDVVDRTCSGASLVLRVDRDDVFVLEGAAAIVWAALEVPATAEEIVADLRAVAPDLDLRTHVTDSLEKLHAAGLVAGPPNR